MPVAIRRFQAIDPVSSSVWTKDFRHLAAIPRLWTYRASRREPRANSVHPKDRIKWWNIVPGDQVRVLGSKDTALREVFRINKMNNRVLLKKENQREELTEARALRSAGSDSVHYSRCQLYVGEHKFPPPPGSTEPETLPVFATRVDMSTPKWAAPWHRFHWERYAVNTVPRLPGWSPESKEKILIPWPKPAKPEPKKATPYETEFEAVLEVTYKPPVLPTNPKALIPNPPSEHEYIKALKTGSEFDPAAPFEVYMEKEVSNPHSRAKKQKRWQLRLLQEKLSLQDYLLQARYKKGQHLNESIAEARWMWKNDMLKQRAEELQRREVVSGREAKREAKRARKAKKQDRINKKLRDLVLDDAANQVLPATA